MDQFANLAHSTKCYFSFALHEFELKRLQNDRCRGEISRVGEVVARDASLGSLLARSESLADGKCLGAFVEIGSVLEGHSDELRMVEKHAEQLGQMLAKRGVHGTKRVAAASEGEAEIDENVGEQQKRGEGEHLQIDLVGRHQPVHRREGQKSVAFGFLNLDQKETNEIAANCAGERMRQRLLISRKNRRTIATT